MTRLVLFVIAIGIAVGLLMPSDFGKPGGPPFARELATLPPPPAAAYASATSPAPMALPGSETVLKRGTGGHFFADAMVNGMPVKFLVDTGATGVALTTADAQRVGLQFNDIEFSVIGSGASGPVRGKMIVLDRVTLGDRTVDQVQGAIIEGGEMSLLGQSFLARMGKIEIENDKMVIR
jgi:aspartyl protease family protein